MASTIADARFRATRLASHGLRHGLDSPEAVVERLVALQAQDFGAARWVLGARLPGSAVGEVDAAIERRAIVRSWPFRGTLHLVPARLLRSILALTGARELQRATRRHAQLELDATVVARAGELADELLSGGRSASRDELQAAWEQAGIATATGRGYHLIWWLALTGRICCGPVDGRSQRFVLLEEWLDPAPALDRDELLGELFAGYAAGHGPVTVRDFAWWTGLTLADAKIALAAAADRVSPYGDRWFTAPEGGETSRPAGAHALAAFDEYFLGYTEREAVCEPHHAARVIPGGNGVFQPLLVADGRVVGLWRRVPRSGDVELEFFDARDERLQTRFSRSIATWRRFSGVEPGETRLAASAD